MYKYLKAKSLIDNNRKFCDVIYPQEEKEVLRIQKSLKVIFPSSYKDFLHQYGSLGIGSQEIYGLTKNNNCDTYIYQNIVCNTLDQRKVNEDPPFPLSFIPIHALGNGELSCLDTSRMNEEGECPVVAWYFGAVEQLSEDFGAFLLEKVIWGLEYLERQGKQVEWLDLKPTNKENDRTK